MQPQKATAHDNCTIPERNQARIKTVNSAFSGRHNAPLCSPSHHQKSDPHRLPQNSTTCRSAPATIVYRILRGTDARSRSYSGPKCFQPNRLRPGLHKFLRNLGIDYIGKELRTSWVILGRMGSILGQNLALPKLLKNTVVLYAYYVFNAYFTVFNVPNDRMTHPWFEHTHKHTHTHTHTHTHARTHARTHANAQA
jgi:hypothetical protein